MTSTNNTNSSGIGSKVKGGAKVAHGVGDLVVGETRGALGSVEKRDSSAHDEIANRGRREIEEGIAMIKGKTVDSTAATAQSTGAGRGGGINTHGATHAAGFAAPPGSEYEQNSTNNANTYGAGNDGWGSGINSANPSATTNPTGFSAPPGQEYAQNSTTNRGAPTDLRQVPEHDAATANPTGLPGPPQAHEYAQDSTTHRGAPTDAHSGTTANPTGIPAPPRVHDYAQDSTANQGAPTDLGRGPNAYSGHGGGNADVEYPTSGGPPPDYGTSTGMGNTHPTQLGTRPVGGREFEGRSVQ